MAPKKDKEFSRKEDDCNPRRRQYAFDDIAALNKGVTPAMATKDDFVLAYKTSSNKVQYICDNKDLLLPWAQILTARLKAAGRLGSILETETDSKKKSTVLSASMSDLTYLTEGGTGESGPEISDAVPCSSVINYNINILEEEMHTPPEQTASTIEKYNIEVSSQHDTHETTSPLEKSLSDIIYEPSLDNKYGKETASYIRDTVNEEEKAEENISITTKYEEATLEPNIHGTNIGMRKFPMSQSRETLYTPVMAAEDFEKDPELSEGGPVEEQSTENPQDTTKTEDTPETEDTPKIIPEVAEVVDQAKTKGYESEHKVIKWGKNELVDYRVST